MSQFQFSAEHRRAELDRARQRNLVKERLFVLLLGPSATGKSTIIEKLNGQAGSVDFSYVKPVMTRPNRPDEKDKTSVSDGVFDDMEARGEFVVVNTLYDVRYGTPLAGILNPLAAKSTPILDYPLETVAALERPEYDTLNVYIYPESTEEWRQRVEGSGRDTGGRLEAGLRELGMLAARACTHPDIHLSVVNAGGAADEAAHTIIESIDAVVA